MIYDCFTFYNELDMLEFRLGVLGPHVDKFVIVEADQTFTGVSRKLCFDEHRDRFAKWADKIIYVPVHDMPGGGSDWLREYFQRDCIARGLTEAQPDDVVLISDVDEIPYMPAVLEGLLDDQPCALEQKFNYFFLNYESGKWIRSVATYFRNMAVSPSSLRHLPGKARIKNAGWHFSYMMDVTRIQEKIASFSHQEVNTASTNNKDHIEKAIRGEVPLFNTGKKRDKFYWQPLDPRLAKIFDEIDTPFAEFVMSKPKGMAALRNELIRRRII